MKRMKQLFLLLLAVMVGIIPAAAQGTDWAADMLTQAGIVKGYGAAGFLADEEITKAEMCNLIVSVMEWEAAAGLREVSYFSDVPLNHWALTSINMMYQLGIVSGDETGAFFPEKSLTFQEGVKMWVAALGYDVVAKNAGGYPSGYIITAANIGLTQGMGLPMTQVMKNQEVMTLVYNAVDIPMAVRVDTGNEIKYTVDKDQETILDRRKLRRGTGQVTANEESTLVPEAKAMPAGFVIIDGVRYNAGSSAVSEYLGYSVEFYYQETQDDPMIVACRTASKNEVLTVSAENIDKSGMTERSFSYYKEGNRKAAETIAQGAVVIYNGRAATIDRTLLSPVSGSVTLIDSGVSGKSAGFDIIRVMDYRHYIVDSVVDSEKRIYIKTRLEDGSFYFEADDEAAGSRIRVLNGGKDVGLINLKRGDSIAAARSHDGKSVLIEILNKTVSGTIKGINDTLELKVDGETYPLSGEFPVNQDNKLIDDKKNVLKVGDAATFYLDRDGKLFYAQGGLAENKSYGFLMQIAADTTVGDDYQVKIFRDTGEASVYPLAKNVRLKNVGEQQSEKTYSRTEAAEKIISRGVRDELVIYKLNEAEELTGLEFSTTGDVTGSFENVFSQDDSIAGQRYGYGRFGKSHLGSNTKIFVINKETDTDYDEELSSVSLGGYFNSGTAYGSADNPIRIYDIGKSGVAGAALVIEKQAGIKSFTKSEWAMILFNRLVKTIGEDGTELTQVVGITNGSERAWTVAENASSTVTGGRKIEEMVMGDVLILETNAKGEIDRYNVIFDSQKMTGGKVFVGGNGYAGESASDTTVYLGNIYYMDNQYIRLKYGSDFITFNVSSDYLVYRYQKGTQPGEKGRLTVASKNDIKYSEFADAAENSKILLHANRNTIKTVIIYE